MDKCPKCGGKFDELLRYCRESIAGGFITECRHKSNGEHLFQRCACGFEGKVRPCKDAEMKKVVADALA